MFNVGTFNDPWRRSRRRFWESLVQGQVRFQKVQRVSNAWFRSTLQKIFKNKTLRLLGIPPMLIFFITPYFEYVIDIFSLNQQKGNCIFLVLLYCRFLIMYF